MSTGKFNKHVIICNYYIALKCKSGNDIIILKIYDEYRNEQHLYQEKPYYANLWNEKKIYK